MIAGWGCLFGGCVCFAAWIVFTVWERCRLWWSREEEGGGKVGLRFCRRGSSAAASATQGGSSSVGDGGCCLSGDLDNSTNSEGTTATTTSLRDSSVSESDDDRFDDDFYDDASLDGDEEEQARAVSSSGNSSSGYSNERGDGRRHGLNALPRSVLSGLNQPSDAHTTPLLSRDISEFMGRGALLADAVLVVERSEGLLEDSPNSNLAISSAILPVAKAVAHIF
mmetsp:Transcript_80794/g.161113  ORF Transcript_80794/g.161113 Transcript_80794/m.161113 type:complete len:224 (+) Transcript_80794:570-1241(+)